ncbi:C-X-C motif chemokine 10-like [Eublepharis macularius]|uniref:C-X-C motif chemokine 10-like n=1 Tax=Eublepharis macularius TaxID=481883 RepID=A0AA97JXH6_EUBMA|nr:C-X-C motif chemokine 10-like [Eublepharis macularius]
MGVHAAAQKHTVQEVYSSPASQGVPFPSPVGNPQNLLRTADSASDQSSLRRERLVKYKFSPGIRTFTRQQMTGHPKGTATISTMNKAFVVFLCTAVLLGTGIQGILTSGRGRCICPSPGSNFIPRKPLEKVEVYAVSASCDRVEIIVTLKQTGEQQCLNPGSKVVQAMLARIAQSRASGNTGRRGKAKAGGRSPQ